MSYCSQGPLKKPSNFLPLGLLLMCGQSSAPLQTEENNVNRCVFDPTEWHLPRYPWDWVAMQCSKDLLLHHLWRTRQAERMNGTRCVAWSRGKGTYAEWSVGVLFTGLGICMFIYWSRHCFCLSSSRSNHRFPTVSLVVLFSRFTLRLTRSLINTYRSLYLP